MENDNTSPEVTVSIIVPAFNAERHVQECLDSIVNQTAQPDEVIFIDDGSTDNTAVTVHEYTKLYPFITYVYQENRGQGTARNKALGKASSTHVMFLDCDDFIHNQTIARCLEWVKKEDPDLVHFEHRKLFENRKGLITYPKENRYFDGISIANGEACVEILNNSTYYTCNNLYRRSFLIENRIRYGAGATLEDYVFLARVGIHAKKICFIHAPLYTYRIHDSSSSQINRETRIPFESFLTGTKECLQAAHEDNASERATAYLINHKIRAYPHVYYEKTPRKYRKEFLTRLYGCFQSYDYGNLQFLSKRARQFVGDGSALSRRKYFSLLLITCPYRIRRRLQKHSGLQEVYWLLHNSKGKIGEVFKILTKAVRRFVALRFEKVYSKQPVLDQTMAIAGLNGLWNGNGKYLYDMLKSNFPGWRVVYLYEKGARIPDGVDAIRINTLRGKALTCRAKVLFLETWRRCTKRNDQIIIQLWHGTPIKRMLFDAAEPYIMEKSPNHRSTQYQQLLTWDFFVCDSLKAKDYFKSCFLIEDHRILTSGYPRVKYLHDNSTNHELKEKIRVSLGVASDEKLISYFPTWRDYALNDNSDNNYLLDTDVFLKHLSSNKKHILFSSGHPYGDNVAKGQHGTFDTQDYILASDWVISDYSSVIFDAIAINIPVVLLMNDREKYQDVRGLYQDVLDDLAFCTGENEIELAEILNNPPHSEKYQYIREKYCQMPGKFSLINDLERLLNAQVNQL